MKCNQSGPGFELMPPCPYPVTITITPQAPPKPKHIMILGRTSLTMWSVALDGVFLEIGIEVRKISSATLRIVLNINQLHCTNGCFKSFKDYSKNGKCSFMKYDIKKFYRSFTEIFLNEALNVARGYMLVFGYKTQIIKHCRKSLLYCNEVLLIKNPVVISIPKWELMMALGFVN